MFKNIFSKQVADDKLSSTDEHQTTGIKIIGKINLDNIPTSVRPVKSTKEYKALESRVLDDYPEHLHKILKCRGRDRIIEAVDRWSPTWPKNIHNISHYKDGDVLQFHVGKNKGIAIGFVDPIENSFGFYISAGLYGNQSIIRRGEELPDGTVAGSWPDDIHYINPASTTQVDMANMFLFPQIDKERTALRELIIEQLVQMTAEIDEKIEQEREREKQESAQLSRSDDYEAPVVDDSVFDSYTELNAVRCIRGNSSFEIDKWPLVSYSLSRPRSYYYNLYGRCNLTIENAAEARNRGLYVPIYILSQKYCEMMNSRYTELTSKYADWVEAITNVQETVKAGCITWVDLSGVRCSVLYYLNNKGNTHWSLIYIEDDNLIFSNVFTHRGIGDDYNQTLYGAQTSVMNTNRDVYSRVLSFLHLFFSMEAESPVVTKECGGKSFCDNTESKSLDDDINIRTAAWYTQYVIPATTVDAYESHRWVGSGDGKQLVPVTVSGYTKSSYVRKSGSSNKE